MTQRNRVEGLKVRVPSKAIAFFTGMTAIVLLLNALLSTDWMTAEGWQQGLFLHCIYENAPTPLPFNVVDPPGCHPVAGYAYIWASATLCIISLLAGITATTLTGLGLRCSLSRKKHIYYRLALYVMNFSLISVLIPLVMYPICLITRFREGNRSFWDVGSGYRICWDAAGFLLVSIFFLMFGEETEIYHTEQYIVSQPVSVL